MDTIPDLSIAVIQALQNFSPVLDGLTRFLSAISSPGFYILLVPPVYWALDKKLGKVTLLALLGSPFLGLCLKQLQGQPRPY